MEIRDRRDTLRMMALCLAPLVASSVPVATLAKVATPAVPKGRFLLKRTVVRDLADGKSLSVERIWQCGFSNEARGMRVDGQQSDCHVVAPPELKALAAMEEGRTSPGPFPALIDASGRMHGGQAKLASETPRAVHLAIDALAARGLNAADLSEARRLLGSLAQAGGAAISAIPADLFFPAPGRQAATRDLEIGEGLTGTVDVTVMSEVRTGGLLEWMTREVVTRIANDSRRSLESWVLTSV